MTTPRQRAHARTRQEILDAARRQVQLLGADRLSLRAAAREVGLVSSAIYRYFAGRDELLTALIVESYESLGEEVEQATRITDQTEAFLAGLRAFHAWARSHRHDYALLYGSPVPNYRAPDTTIAPAARAPMALMRVVAEAHAAGRLAPAPIEPGDPALAQQCRTLSDALDTPLPQDLTLHFAHAWAQTFGLVTLDVFGQLAGTFEPADPLAEHTFRTAAARIGFAL